MPKSSLMGLRWVFAPAAAIVAALACCPPAGAIVGGKQVIADGNPPTTGPLNYQVALIRNDRPSTLAGQFCGGSVRNDAGEHFHVVTAAHCVFDNTATAPGQPIAPANLDVFVGKPKLNDPGGHRLHVSAVSIDPAFDPSTLAHDAAVLTLSTKLDGTGALPIDFETDDPWVPPPGSTAAVVSGWGRIEGGIYPNDLRWAEMPFASDSSCQASWADEGIDTSIQVCAGRPGVDSCFGDSGGPLVVNFDDPINNLSYPLLAGIVSYGNLDCDGSPPGVYTRVASPAILSYLTQPNPISAPRNASPPTVGGTAAVGETITCGAGSWSRHGREPRLPVPAWHRRPHHGRGDEPRRAAELCRHQRRRREPVGLLRQGPQRRRHGLQPEHLVVHRPRGADDRAASSNQSPSQAPQDTAAPVARITKTACTATRCTLTVAVTDVGFSAGIKTVQSTVRSTYRSRCKRKGSHKTVACTKHRTSRPSVAALTSTRYKVVASKLPYGTQRFTIVAIDKAGHRQALPTTKTVTTKKPKKHR